LKSKEVQNIQRIYFPELDGLRFFAFILVFIHHHSLFTKIPYFSFLQAYGWIGVDLFFVLSSFLFTKLLTTEFSRTKRINFKKFYLRRIFRIWPIYFAFIGFSLAWFFLHHEEMSKNITIRLIGLFTFSDNILAATKGLNPLPYTSHLWTIAYEEQFYIFIPIIILILVRSSLRTKIISLISVFILFTSIRHFLIMNKASYTAISVLPITHFESIILGIVVGFGGFDFFLKRINPFILGVIGVLFFALVCLLSTAWNYSNWLHVTYLSIGMFSSFTLFSVLNIDLLKKLFSINLFVYLGKRSYGLYVYHLFGNAIATILIKYIPSLPSNLLASFIYSLSFTILISIISYKIIEKPFLKLKKKFEVIRSRPI
jgi:peptidoglycan/LPS O-acetylase OafA/YrhL